MIDDATGGGRELDLVGVRHRRLFLSRLDLIDFNEVQADFPTALAKLWIAEDSLANVWKTASSLSSATTLSRA